MRPFFSKSGRDFRWYEAVAFVALLGLCEAIAPAAYQIPAIYAVTITVAAYHFAITRTRQALAILAIVFVTVAIIYRHEIGL